MDLKEMDIVGWGSSSRTTYMVECFSAETLNSNHLMKFESRSEKMRNAPAFQSPKTLFFHEPPSELVSRFSICFGGGAFLIQ